MNKFDKGFSLMEMVVSLAIFGSLTLIGSSMLDQARHAIALAGGTAELRSLFQRARLTAIVHNRNIAVRFAQVSSGWSWTVYEDGDGDGVRNDDITKGIDFPLGRTQIFNYAPVRIGVPSGAYGSIVDPFTGKALNLRPPVRFGNSLLCSFSREGEATNGSVVLTDGKSATIIQVLGTSALINVLRWDGTHWIKGV